MTAKELFGDDGFVIIDDRPWAYLISRKSGEWWLYYWSDGNKCFVTMRPLSPPEVNQFRVHAISPEKAQLYAGLYNPIEKKLDDLKGKE